MWGQYRDYFWGVAVGLTALLLQAAGPAVAQALRYQREAILHGEIWRLLTGQLLHLGWSHLLLNLVALALITALFGRLFRPGVWAWIYAGSFLATTLGLLLLQPGLQWYVGLSGALHGLFAAGAVVSIRRRESGAVLLLAVLVFKLGWEQLAGPLPGSTEWSGGTVITAAHLYGAIGGVLVGLLLPRMVVRP
ncbi:MAG TPA: rhombosortase [Gammaproteobacteria bacterium]|nr:rhombosortase [Gammaproteobacteria bacterium]